MAGSVLVVQSDLVKVLTSYNVNPGVINRIRKNQCSHVNGSHQDSSVNFLLALRGSSKMERSGHIRRSVYKTQDVKFINGSIISVAAAKYGRRTEILASRVDEQKRGIVNDPIGFHRWPVVDNGAVGSKGGDRAETGSSIQVLLGAILVQVVHNFQLVPLLLALLHL